VADGDLSFRHDLSQSAPDLLDALHAVVDKIHLAAPSSSRKTARADEVIVVLADVGSDGQALFGGVSIVLMSRTPVSDMYSVRGMGVAVQP